MRRILIIIVALLLIGYLMYVFLFPDKVRDRELARSSYQVLLLLPGSIDDGSWNQSAFDAISKLGWEMKIDVSYRDNLRPEEIGDVIKEFDEDKALFIIGWGGEYQGALEKLALDYPAHKFALAGNYAGNGKNYGCISNQSGAFYLAGVLAAMNSKSRSVGAIIGEKLPHIVREISAFQKGVLSYDPEIRVVVSWLNTWEDSTKAINETQQMTANGCDVILVNADIAGLPIHKIMESQGRYTIGVVNDAATLAPKAVLTSVMINSEVLLRKAIELFIQGRWEGKVYRYGLIDGALYLTDFNPVVTQQQRDRMDQVYSDLVTQKLIIDDLTE